MESSSWKSMLRDILNAAPQIREESSDERVKSLINAAQIMARYSLVSESASGVIAAAELVVATYNMSQLVDRSVENYRREHLPKNYGQYANFIEEINSEINQQIDCMHVSVESIQTLVNNMASVKKDELDAFVDDVSINVRLIEVEIEGCEKKIAFAVKAMKQLNEMANSSVSYLEYITRSASSLPCPSKVTFAKWTTWAADEFSAAIAKLKLLSKKEKDDERPAVETNSGKEKSESEEDENDFVDLSSEIPKTTLEELFEKASDFLKSVK